MWFRFWWWAMETLPPGPWTHWLFAIALRRWPKRLPDAPR